MELLNSLKSEKKYCTDINNSEYVQRLCEYPKDKCYQDINNLFIDKFDPTCSILEDKEKDIYFIQRLLEIATDIDEKSKTHYINYKYSKNLKASTVQSGLQKPNTLTSVIYLGDLYNVTPVIYIDALQVKVVSSLKTRENLNILYKDGTFMVLDDVPEFKYGEFINLQGCLELNIKNLDVYAIDMLPISKYKVSELTELAKKLDVSTEINGKNKIKKDLYKDLTVKLLNSTV